MLEIILGVMCLVVAFALWCILEWDSGKYYRKSHEYRRTMTRIKRRMQNYLM